MNYRTTFMYKHVRGCNGGNKAHEGEKNVNNTKTHIEKQA